MNQTANATQTNSDSNAAPASTKPARARRPALEAASTRADIKKGSDWHGRLASNQGALCTIAEDPIAGGDGVERVVVRHASGRVVTTTTKSLLSDYAHDKPAAAVPATPPANDATPAAQAPIVIKADVTAFTKRILYTGQVRSSTGFGDVGTVSRIKVGEETSTGMWRVEPVWPSVIPMVEWSLVMPYDDIIAKWPNPTPSLGSVPADVNPSAARVVGVFDKYAKALRAPALVTDASAGDLFASIKQHTAAREQPGATPKAAEPAKPGVAVGQTRTNAAGAVINVVAYNPSNAEFVYEAAPGTLWYTDTASHIASVFPTIVKEDASQVPIVIGQYRTSKWKGPERVKIEAWRNSDNKYLVKGALEGAKWLDLSDINLHWNVLAENQNDDADEAADAALLDMLDDWIRKAIVDFCRSSRQSLERVYGVKGQQMRPRDVIRTLVLRQLRTGNSGAFVR